MCPKISAAPKVCPLADSIRAEFSPSPSTRRAAKFGLGKLGIPHLAELGLHDPADFFDVFHFHQVVDVEGQPEFLLKTAGESYVAHRVPGCNVVGSGVYRNRLWIHVERGLKRRLYSGQYVVHRAAWPLSRTGLCFVQKFELFNKAHGIVHFALLPMATRAISFKISETKWNDSQGRECNSKTAEVLT